MTVKTSRAPHSKSALVGLVLLGVWILFASAVTTQWLAAQFGYQAALGERGAFGLYSPFAWVGWIWKFYRSAPVIFGWGWVGFAAAVTVGGVAYALSVGFGSRSIKKHDGVHGTAHWATEAEIRESGLLPSTQGVSGAGVYCGAWRDRRGNLHYLRHNGPEHVAAIAPTRSGKGVGLVIPTLLSWPHSVVVNDMKGELWAMTAGWRKEAAGNIVLKFEPAAAEGSVAFNPLEEVRIGTLHEVGDVQNLVTIIVDPDGKGMDHWRSTAHAFLTGLILHLQYMAAEKESVASLPDVAEALSDPTRPIGQLYDEMIANRHVVIRDAAGAVIGRESHDTVSRAARDMLNRAENERSSVLSTAMSFLSLYRDPLVARNVSRSDFKLSDLMNYEEVAETVDPETGEVRVVRTPKPLSLYIVMRAEDKHRLTPLMRLMINQIIRVLLRPTIEYVEGQEIAPHLQRLLLMLDEFPSFGRLDVFQEALAYIAGYGIKAYLIMQDTAQLQAAYGRDESITSNCHVRVAYAPNRIDTAKWLSDNSGVTTVITERISTSGARFGAFLTNVSRSYSEGSRALITPDEVSRLRAPVKSADKTKIISAGDVLVFSAGHAPIKGEQSLYFLDPTFSARVKIRAPELSDTLQQRRAERPVASATEDASAFRAFAEAREQMPAPSGECVDPAGMPASAAPGRASAIPTAGKTRRASTNRALLTQRDAEAVAGGDQQDLLSVILTQETEDTAQAEAQDDADQAVSA